MNSDLLNNIRKNDIRAISKLISSVENGAAANESTLNSLFPFAQESIRIGFTGPPGSGKSTLIDKIVQLMRTDGNSVGVVSVDPSSPFSGGALLGDRVRMHRHFLDKHVFIRSMGSRGQKGGLARRSEYVADILASTGKDYILFETVGVGQSEIEIVRNVDITVVLFVPESGDEIQFMKAGPVEAGDVFVINKADREGADRMSRILEDYVNDSFLEGSVKPKTFLTVATDGKGVEPLYRECIEWVTESKKSGKFSGRRQDQYVVRVRNAVKSELVKRFWQEDRESDLIERIKLLRDADISPYEAARQLISSL